MHKQEIGISLRMEMLAGCVTGCTTLHILGVGDRLSSLEIVRVLVENGALLIWYVIFTPPTLIMLD